MEREYGVVSSAFPIFYLFGKGLLNDEKIIQFWVIYVVPNFELKFTSLLFSH